MAMYPVGPLSASTYWRRRGLLLIAAIVVLLVAKSCVGAGGSSPAKVTAAATPTPSATASTTPSAPVITAPTPAPSATPTAVIGNCPDSAITLAPATDLEDYPVGTSPRLTVTIRNSGTVPCRRDLGSGAVELLVFSGNDRVWSSDDCNNGTAVAATLLKAGATQAVVRTWDGKRSAPGCVGSKAQGAAGTYRFVARVGTLQSGSAVFRFGR